MSHAVADVRRCDQVRVMTPLAYRVLPHADVVALPCSALPATEHSGRQVGRSAGPAVAKLVSGIEQNQRSDFNGLPSHAPLLLLVVDLLPMIDA